MEKKALIPLFVLFLVFSSAAVPISRSLKSFKDEPAIQDLLAQREVSTKTKGELLDGEEVFREGRMDMEGTDYPGTGANNHHDPKTPGTTV